MPTLIRHYGPYFRDRDFLRSLVFGIALFLLSLLLNFYAGAYATEQASNSVTDIVLSNLPTFDVDGIFVYGSFIFWLFIAYLCLRKPNIVPFTAKSIALFIFIRSIFISLTHIGPFPTQITIHSTLLEKFSFGGDLFFSGHVGLPFLMALCFWDSVFLRLVFIACSLFFGAVVLMGHLHYSIDVLSAYFITFTIYRIAETMFAKDQKTFLSGPRT